MILEQPVEMNRESEKDDETDEEIDYHLTFPLSIDSEDFCGITLDDVTTDKMHPPNTENLWKSLWNTNYLILVVIE
jgi:hypothetical protein